MHIALPRAIQSSFRHTASRFYCSTLTASLFPSLFHARNHSAMAARSKDFEFDRQDLEDLLKRRFFVSRAFDIYGGVAGLYDLGPPGCALQANIVDTWRRHFILEEDMLEVDCTMLTPEAVLKTSGHVARFSDWMCKDKKTGEIFRADHLVEQVIEDRLKSDKEARGADVSAEDPDSKKKKLKIKKKAPVKLPDHKVALYEKYLAQIDNYSGEELGKIIVEEEIVNPQTGGVLEPPVEFNLMFDTAIGPSGDLKGYLRPETAQGQFLNFSKLLEFNNARMPFASASIGKSFRNEISPRAGLLRVREFLMAEIEHFVDPKNKQHPRFVEVKDLNCRFLPKGVQQAGKTDLTETTVGEAVRSGMVDNETLGYFLARIWLFLTKIGCDMTRVRFRQHMNNEMAHYASDCWDAELHTSYGWIECVGCADRSAYDLSSHSAATNTKLVVRQALETPVVSEVWEPIIDQKKFGPAFKKESKALQEVILKMSQMELESTKNVLEGDGKAEINMNGNEYIVTPELMKIERVTKKETIYEYIPNVIEPSFGIGRILYSLIEHIAWPRPEDKQRGVLSFPALIAPTKCLLVPLSNHESFAPIIRELSSKLRSHGISNKVDDSSQSIGRRYARNDELGTPFGITVDFQTVKDNTITLRERDSTSQIRATQEEVFQIIKDIVDERRNWEDVVGQYGEFKGQE